ncbi:hypothetical protein ACFLTM_00460 [Candidatus Bipolaricaulota bacterium]
MKRVAGLAVCMMLVGVTALAVLGEQPPSVNVGVLTRDGIGARALAFGGAYVSFADDTTAAYYNPAGLPGLSGIRVGGMYESKFDPSLGTSFQYLSGTFRLDSIGMGTGLTVVRRSDLGIPGPGGTFDTSESLLLLSAGYDLLDLLAFGRLSALSIGSSFKLYSSQGFADARAVGVGFDLGALVVFSFDGWDARVGLKSSDVLGSKLKWSDTLNEIAEVVPWGHVLGFGFVIPDWGLRSAVDLSLYPEDAAISSIRLGAEWVVFGIALRAGLDDGRPIFGVGVAALDWLTVDFAIELDVGPGPGLGPSFIVSTEFSL